MNRQDAEEIANGREELNRQDAKFAKEEEERGLKAVDGLVAMYKAQVLSYLKATRLGLLINFNVPILRDGLQRVILS